MSYNFWFDQNIPVIFTQNQQIFGILSFKTMAPIQKLWSQTPKKTQYDTKYGNWPQKLSSKGPETL